MKFRAIGSLYNIKKGEEAFFGNIAVDSKFRRKGLGKIVVEGLIKDALEKYKIKKIKVHCNSQNVSGLLFYSRLGFCSLKIFEINKQNRKNAVLELVKILC